ncbi:MAG TPA: hypothetical protein VJZ71_20245 [Phycisphaerae bacterium]|nr:hypothetical protein [Phycisphaerae bacterium]
MKRIRRLGICSAVLMGLLTTIGSTGCDESQPNGCPIDYSQDGHIGWDEGLRFLSDQTGQSTLAGSRTAQQACQQLSTDVDQYIKR